MDETKRLSEWIKRHKKELIIAGVSSAAIVALIFGYRNQEQLTGIKNSLDHLFFKRAQVIYERIGCLFLRQRYHR